MSRITINNLGPISNFEMDIKQFNLFIGEQATGKSTVCKAIYFFLNIETEIINYLYDIAIDGKKTTDFSNYINESSKKIFIDLFGYDEKYLNSTELMCIYDNNISCNVSFLKSNNNINVQFSSEFNTKIMGLEKESIDYHKNIKKAKSLSDIVSLERIELKQNIRDKIKILLGGDAYTYYIPAGRNLFTLLANQKTTLDYSAIDMVNRKFMQLVEGLQPLFKIGTSNLYKYFSNDQKNAYLEKISSEITTILKGEYINVDKRSYLRMPNSQKKIPINYISSGQQEILWLLNILYFLILNNTKSFVIIEEPEAHLYPTLQKYVLDFIVKFMNITGSTVILTTHSPYILTCANNLLVAGSLKIKNIGDVEKITGDYQYIYPKDMQAFKLIKKSNTTEFKKLINSKFKELSTELIDEVSDDINSIYTELFYLENSCGD